MKKILLYIFVVSIILGSITGCVRNKVKTKTNGDSIENSEINKSEESSFVKVIINEKEYSIILEDNETTKEFVNLLPLEFKMSELNGNEKYIYLDEDLPTNLYNPKRINAGDVMLYGNNCLVIFYKSFDTNYSYTKIGHIDNLPDLGSNDIKVIITK